VYYTNANVKLDATPKSTTAPKMSRQKKGMYELLVRVTNEKVVPGRKMKTDVFFSEIKNLTTKLDAETKASSDKSDSRSAAASDPMRSAVDNAMGVTPDDGGSH
jgi:hypothetical protein